MFFSRAALVGAASTLFLASTFALPEPHYGSVITRDVLIVGGGSTGTFGATRLLEMNKTVLVVEQKYRLGGHTETYTDPATGLKSDIGVVIWHNTSLVNNYFAHYDVPLTKADFGASGGKTYYTDLSTGEVVANYTPANPAAGLQAYAAQLVKYPYLDYGYDLPYPVPSDLLLPFQAFVEKYDLGTMVQTAFQYGQGVTNFLNQSTIYIMKNFGLTILESLETGFLTTARHDNSELYEKATSAFASTGSVLLNTTVLSGNRMPDATGYMNFLVASTDASGCKSYKLVRAKQLLITIPPTLSALRPFDLDSAEVAIFSQWNTSNYWTGLLKCSGIPDTDTILNIGANTPYNVPNLPATYTFYPSGIPDVQHVYYGTPYVQSEQEVKDTIFAELDKIKAAHTLNTTTQSTTFDILSDHAPFELVVPAKQIADGFYKDMYALQGQRRTFWTGAAWHTQDSTLLWQFTEGVVAAMMKA
ncbi:amine oxidase, flavin-containing superfamily [Saccharata proteae CBS 121410]|uniref:Amine oxidase, flavin-containing superfamily n=1 Tax=Saccharata proteae CBS 121410 TaxID=1314787 RepID=A0A9P4HZZ7_9PEZI|nr:amine oxidase, flavin-containing superfamily [Saccharata proteae CBS 121410]